MLGSTELPLPRLYVVENCGVTMCRACFRTLLLTDIDLAQLYEDGDEEDLTPQTIINHRNKSTRKLPSSIPEIFRNGCNLDSKGDPEPPAKQRRLSLTRGGSEFRKHEEPEVKIYALRKSGVHENVELTQKKMANTPRTSTISRRDSTISQRNAEVQEKHASDSTEDGNDEEASAIVSKKGAETRSGSSPGFQKEP
eukprot:3788436-Rhodomonas_salina.1